LQQGDEMGRFLLGSTVVMLWPQNTLVINKHWEPGLGVRLGEKMSEPNN
jgi:phosphatidylserine decarboxylase